MCSEEYARKERSWVGDRPSSHTDLQAAAESLPSVAGLPLGISIRIPYLSYRSSEYVLFSPVAWLRLLPSLPVPTW